MKVILQRCKGQSIFINGEWWDSYSTFSRAIAGISYELTSSHYSKLEVIIPSIAKTAIDLHITWVGNKNFEAYINTTRLLMCQSIFTKFTGIKPKIGIIKINIKAPFNV